MHRCLLMEDLIVLVCEELEFDTSSLASVARTTKAFTDPALNVLWRCQESVYHLFQVFPEDIWDTERANTDEEQYILVHYSRPPLYRAQY